MSASSIPILRPLAASASARLAAVVDLPTPPLPEATATIVLHAGHERLAGPGLSGPPARGRAPAARCGGAGAARMSLRGQHRGDRQDAGQGLDRLLGRLAQRLEMRPALRVDLDREADMAVAHDEPRHHAQADDVLAAVGIEHAAQRVEHLGFGRGSGGHGRLSLICLRFVPICRTRACGQPLSRPRGQQSI